MRRCEDEWSDSRLGQSTSGEIRSSVDRLEGWVGPTACMDSVEKRSISAVTGDRTLILRPSSSWYSRYSILTQQSRLQEMLYVCSIRFHFVPLTTIPTVDFPNVVSCRIINL